MQYIFKIIITLSLFLAFSAQSEEIDHFGRNIKIPEKINRIISLSPANTEILYSLNLSNKIVGITSDCNYPPETKSKEKIGKFGFFNLEKIIRLKPDIIFATKDMGKKLASLKKINIPLITLETTSIESVLENINLVGKITKKSHISNKVNQHIKNELNKFKTKENKPSVFYCVWHKPIYTAGGKSFIGDLIRTAGGNNIAENIKSPFAQYNIESLILKNPDVLIITKSTYKNIDFKKLPWKQLSAVKKKNILIADDDIYQRPSPRIILALEELNNFLYKVKK